MVPSSWITTTIGEAAELGSGSTPSRSKQSDYFDGGTIPWVKTGDLNNDLVQHTEECITQQALEESSCKIYPVGTLLVAMYGGFKQIGRTGLLGCDAAINQALTAISLDQQIACPAYVQQWLNCRVDHWKRLAGSSRKDPNITKSEVAAFPLLLPPANEQRAIVCILSTWDRGIRQLTDLIAATVRLKQGLMQQLLTGQRQFPEFGNDLWIEHHLGDLFSERAETNCVDLPLLSITADRGVIPRTDIDRKDTSNQNKSLYKRIAQGDIGYNTMRMWQGVSAVSMYEGIVSPAYTICIPGPDIDADFAGYLFKYPPIVHLFYRFSQGLVDDTLNLKFHHFAQIRVRIPSVKEQKKIAQVFSKCDEEIDVLRKQLDALKQQKKGVMQKLLTGEVRVPLVWKGDGNA